MIKLPKFGLAKLLVWGTLLVLVLMQPVWGSAEDGWIDADSGFTNIQMGVTYTAESTEETTVHPAENFSLNLTNLTSYVFTHNPDIDSVIEDFYIAFNLRGSAQAGPTSLISSDNSDRLVQLEKPIGSTTFTIAFATGVANAFLLNIEGPLTGTTNNDKIYSYLRFDDVTMYYKTDTQGNRVSNNDGSDTTFTSSLTSPVNTIVSIKDIPAATNEWPIIRGQRITQIKFDISYPPVMTFQGIANKYGVQLFGLECPNKIEAFFYRVPAGANSANSQAILVDHGRSDWEVERQYGEEIAGFIYIYPTAPAVTDMIPSNVDSPDTYTYKYYYRYSWDVGQATYSPVYDITDRDAVINDDSFQIIFSRNQAAVSTTAIPTW